MSPENEASAARLYSTKDLTKYNYKKFSSENRKILENHLGIIKQFRLVENVLVLKKKVGKKKSWSCKKVEKKKVPNIAKIRLKNCTGGLF